MKFSLISCLTLLAALAVANPFPTEDHGESDRHGKHEPKPPVCKPKTVYVTTTEYVKKPYPVTTTEYKHKYITTTEYKVKYITTTEYKPKPYPVTTTEYKTKYITTTEYKPKPYPVTTTEKKIIIKTEYIKKPYPVTTTEYVKKPYPVTTTVTWCKKDDHHGGPKKHW
jgi:hypothetical protein